MREVDCPRCLAVLRVPDDGVARLVRCPACTVIFTSTPSASSDRAARSDHVVQPVYEVDEILPPRERPRQLPPERVEGGPVVDVLPPREPVRELRAERDDPLEVLAFQPPPPPPIELPAERDVDPPAPPPLADDEILREAEGPPRDRAERLRRARLGVFLHFVAAAFGAVSAGVWVGFVFLAWFGVAVDGGMYALVGLPALVAWILGGIAFACLAAGPRRRSLPEWAIAGTAVCALHLVLLVVHVVDAGDKSDALLADYATGRTSTIQWQAFGSQLPTFTMVPTWLVLGSRGSVGALAILVPLLELARLVLLAVVVKSAADAVNLRAVADQASSLLALGPTLVACAALFNLAAAYVLREAPADATTARHTYAILAVLASCVVTGVLWFAALVTRAAAEGYGARRIR